jgi:hypothetical protein
VERQTSSFGSYDKMLSSRVINRGLAVRQGVVVTRKFDDGGAKVVDGIYHMVEMVQPSEGSHFMVCALKWVSG